MIHSLILINRQGKVRLVKYYESFPMQDRSKMVREVNKIKKPNKKPIKTKRSL